MRTAHTPERAPHSYSTLGGSLARRWYYTPKSHRAYSVRQIAPGDRRLLAEFTLALGQSDESADALRPLSEALSRALGSGDDMAAGFVALEGTAGGDRVIGVTAYAPDSEGATFNIAVATGFRDEQVGRTLLATLIRHAKRVGIRRVHGEMAWSNRPMHLLAQATGFTVEAVTGDRSRRSLVLSLK